MALITDYLVQGCQMLLILLLAPLLTGWVRVIKARLLRRRGSPLLQPYRDLYKLLGKEVVLAESASWLFRVAPYLIFAAIWVAAALVPTFANGLLFSWTADLIAIVALLGSARFFLALGRAGCGDQLWRDRLQPRNDDRLAGRTGDADDGVHVITAGRHHRIIRRRPLSC
jgi:formate hydrogenlyase subunit 4